MRWEIRRVLYALVAFMIIVVLGGLGLWGLGDHEYSLGDCIYFALITAATVGFAELPDITRHYGMRIVTGILILSGLGVIAFFQSTLTAVLVEGVIAETFRRRRMQKKVGQLKDHLVVAGVGRTGKYIVEELDAIRRDFVVIDKDEEILKKLNEELNGRLLYVVGDATEDHTLLEAGVERAHGVMAALTADRDNLFIVLSVRALNPKARIVSKVVELENEGKIVRAGADQTVSPHRMGGLRMVSELVRPKVTEFLDRMLRVTKNLRFEEIEVPPHSRYASKSLREVPIRQETRLLVVALHEPGGEYIYNPAPEHQLHAGTQLIVMGDPDGVEKLRDLMGRA
ncbi:MAG TPA: potassium channel protein [Polyangiaceae bacterium]|jgi:voltage-gated potassium channel